MITNFFIPELNNHDVQELWFQQDGARCHTARATIDLLKDAFGDRLISRFGPVNWPPRPCDLTPLDYFLWGYVKSLVYADKPQTLDHLEDNIRRVISDIRPQMLEKVIENWMSRLDYIRASRGSPMPEIIFKMAPSELATPVRSSETYSTNTEECRFFIKNDDPSIEQKECAAFHSRRESISGESTTSFLEDTSMPYLGFEPEFTRLQAECHDHHARWVAVWNIPCGIWSFLHNVPQHVRPACQTDDITGR
ncbi:uncharacterized protein TNCV_187481 [Trichonephila clavipes]|nr:uncharacterized protein TNCV_187481 [Trichonephila clavipes]